MSFFNLKEHDLVLFVSSGNVSGAVVQFQKSSLPKIVYTCEAPFPVKEGVTAEALSGHMLTALHAVLSNLHTKYKSRVTSVQVALASPWFSSFSKSLHIQKETPFVVSAKTIEKLVDEQVGTTKGDVIMEKTPSHIKLNGYETSNPFGKLAENLDVSVYASTVPVFLKEKIQSEISKTVHPGSIAFHSFPFIAWNVIKPLFTPKEDFIFIDVGSEISDILVIRHGAISSVASFPLGKNQLIRNVAVHFGTKPALADTLVNLYASDTADAGVKERVRTLVTAFGEEWGLKFASALQEGKETADHFLPQRAFFVSDKNVASVFSDIIEKQIPNTTTLSNDNLSQFVEFGSNESLNIFLALTAITLNNRFSHS